MSRFLLVAFCLMSISIVRADVGPNDWPTVQRDIQRTGWAPFEPRLPYEPLWMWASEQTFPADNKDLTSLPYRWKARFNRSSQPVILNDILVVGSTNGKVYALDLKTGRTRWTFKTGGPILHAAALGKTDVGSRAFIASGDGIVYALDLSTGQKLWSFDGASSVAYMSSPMLLDGNVYIGSRNRFFYALNSETGKLAWQYEAEAPITNTAASDGKRIFFGSDDGVAHALGAKSGEELWQFNTTGGSMRHYWPVVAGDAVIFRAMMLNEKSEYTNKADGYLNAYVRGCVRKELGLPADRELSKKEKKQIDKKIRSGKYNAPWKDCEEGMRDLVKNSPMDECVYVLDVNTGKRKFYAPVGIMSRHQDVPPPPIVSPEGKVYLWSRYTESSSRRSGFGSFLTHEICQLDMKTGSLSSPMKHHSRKEELRNCTDDYAFLSGVGSYFSGNHGTYALMPIVEDKKRRMFWFRKWDEKSFIKRFFGKDVKLPKRDPMFLHDSDYNLGRGLNSFVFVGDYVVLLKYENKQSIFCWKAKQGGAK